MNFVPKGELAGCATLFSAVAVLSLISLSAVAQGDVAPPAGASKSPSEIENYWTKERMQEARPVPMPQTDAMKRKAVKPEERGQADGGTPLTEPRGR
jgi:hypothetical protein